MNYSFITTNFTAGEISPRLLGRTDVARYNNGAREILNGVPLIHGGVIRRPGLRYVAVTKDSTMRSRLVEFTYSTTQAYILEFGDGYIRFYDDAGAQIELSPGVPYEVTTSITEAMLPDMDYCQAADTMFLFHPDLAIQRLQRFDDDNWRLQASPVDPEPFDELGILATMGCTLSSAAVGSRTFTAASAVFLVSDVGRQITSAAGIGTITGYTSTTVVTVNVTTAFPGTSLLANAWTIEGSPQTSCTPSAKDPVGTSISLTLGAAGWRSDDVGKFVNINGGTVKITGYTSTTVVTAQLRTELAAVVAAEANAWYLGRSMWGGPNGYPRSGSLFQQRLFVGGSTGFPQSVWFSELGNPYSFEIGVEADSAYEMRLVADQANPIVNLASGRAVIALTTGAEFSLGSDAGISPSTVTAINQSAYGSANVAPCRVGAELLFVGRSSRKIRAMAADRFDPNAYAAPDITALAEHITESGIIEIDAQPDPESIVWAVRTDGVMATCTLDRDNDVVAWARQITDGTFESVCVVPFGESFSVWAVVNRTISGATVRYVERFDWDLLTDCAITGTNGSPTASWAGLDHLEGLTVSVRGDGILQTDKLVTGGAITIDTPATSVEIGLNYTTRVKMLAPEIQGPTGTIQARLNRVYEAALLVIDTIGATVNDYPIIFQEFGPDVLDAAQTPFTGWKKLETLGFEVMNELIIEQTQPLPFHLAAVVRRVDVGQWP